MKIHIQNLKKQSLHTKLVFIQIKYSFFWGDVQNRCLRWTYTPRYTDKEKSIEWLVLRCFLIFLVRRCNGSQRWSFIYNKRFYLNEVTFLVTEIRLLYRKYQQNDLDSSAWFWFSILLILFTQRGLFCLFRWFYVITRMHVFKNNYGTWSPVKTIYQTWLENVRLTNT